MTGVSPPWEQKDNSEPAKDKKPAGRNKGKTYKRRPRRFGPKEEPTEKPGHRPPHEPTDEERAVVSTLKGLVGLRDEEIAEYIGISAKTLAKHYSVELRKARTSIKMDVANALYVQATRLHNTAAAIFFLKTQCGWKPPEGNPGSESNYGDILLGVRDDNEDDDVDDARDAE